MSEINKEMIKNERVLRPRELVASAPSLVQKAGIAIAQALYLSMRYNYFIISCLKR